MTDLLQLYLQLGGSVLLGWGIGKVLPPSVPRYLGQFLFWVGVPLSVMVFLRQADLTGAVWLAPGVAWGAMVLGVGLAVLGIQGLTGWGGGRMAWRRPSQGSFILATMVGNTGYLGYPVALMLMGPSTFAWTLFYDLVGSTLVAYTIGVALAAYCGEGVGEKAKLSPRKLWGRAIRAIAINPTLWCFGLGLALKSWDLSPGAESILQELAWGTVAIALVLIGMRLGQIRRGPTLGRALLAVVIKMVLVPLVVGGVLGGLGLTGPPLLAMVLQAGMPPAFATLILAEAYHLDYDLTVTALVLGSSGLMVTLPLWLWLFG